MPTYFSTNGTERRFFYVIGNTDDEFFPESIAPLSINEMLFRQLKEDGYERIVFYNYSRKLFFYDEVSRDATKHPKRDIHGERTDTSDMTSPWIDDPNFIDPTKVESVLGEDAVDDRFHMGRLDDSDIQSLLDALMEDSKVKTAFVFDDANIFVTGYGEYITQGNFKDLVCSSFGRWMSLPADNRNIIVFVFPKSNHEEIVTQADNWHSKLWDSYLKDDFTNYRGVIEVGKATYGEIENLLDYFRIMKGLKIDLSDYENIVREITAYYLSSGWNLRDLHRYIETIIDNNLTLDDEYCIKYFHSSKHESAFEKIDALTGMGSIKELVEDLKNRAKKDLQMGFRPFDDTYYSRIQWHDRVHTQATNLSLCYAITGNPGTGKTTVATLFGEIFKELGYLPSGHLVKTERADLVGQYVGATAIKTQRKIDEAMGGVLFIDEAYSLFKEGDGEDFGREAIDTLVDNMTKHQGEFSVIIAGYPGPIKRMLDKANPGLTRRFRKVVNIDDYTPDELMQIADKYCVSHKYRMDDKLHAALVDYVTYRYKTRDENWGNAGTIINMIDDIYQKWNPDDSSFDEKGNPIVNLTMKDMTPEFKDYYDRIKNRADLGDAASELEKMVGLQSVKDTVKELQADIEMGSAPEPGHYLFIGNPGTGKTTTARIMGKIFRHYGLLAKGDVIETSARDFVAGYVGQTSIKTQEVLKSALDNVLLIDEAYLLSDKGGSSSFNGEALGAILKFMEDNRKRICVICTGYDREMGEFLASNSGLESRFTSKLHFDDYSVDELIEILKSFAKEDHSLLNLDYYKASRTVFEIAKRNENFGNGRFVRQYYLHSRKKKNLRLYKKYKEKDLVPSEEMALFTKDDIPDDCLTMLQEGKEEQAIAKKEKKGEQL